MDEHTRTLLDRAAGGDRDAMAVAMTHLSELADRAAKQPGEPRETFRAVLEALLDGGTPGGEDVFWLWLRRESLRSARYVWKKFHLRWQDCTHEDLAHDVLASLAKLPPDRLAEVWNWPGFVYRTTYNTAMARNKRIKQQADDSAVRYDTPVAGADGVRLFDVILGDLAGEDASEQAAYRDLEEFVEKLLREHRQEYFEVWRLNRMGYKYEEIARMLGRPPGTVASYIHRIREFLRNGL